MSRYLDLLDQVRIASPCTASWDAMTGDDRVRFCGECKLNVYNVSGMSREEAAALLEKTDGRLCMRIYRRPDGTLLTKDCPVGLRAIRRKLAVVAAAFGALLAGFAGLFAWKASTVAAVPPDGSTSPVQIPVTPVEPPNFIMGEAVAPEVLQPQQSEPEMGKVKMGRVALPPDGRKCDPEKK